MELDFALPCTPSRDKVALPTFDPDDEERKEFLEAEFVCWFPKTNWGLDEFAEFDPGAELAMLLESTDMLEF